VRELRRMTLETPPGPRSGYASTVSRPTPLAQSAVIIYEMILKNFELENHEIEKDRRFSNET
jgi:uncharacterized protein YpbB